MHDFDEHVLRQGYSLLTYQHEMNSVNIDDDWDQCGVVVVAAAAAVVVVVAKNESH